MCFSRKGMKTVMKWLRILLVIAVVMIAVFGCRMAKYSMSIKPQTLEEAEKWQQGMLNKNICKFNTRTVFRNKKARKDIHAPIWMNRGTGAL